MTRHKKHPKIDQNINVPKSRKVPRVEAYRNNLITVWQFQSMDFEGVWGWHQNRKISTNTLLEIRTKLAQFESMTWLEIEGSKSHFIEVTSLDKKAQKRLEEIKQDDIEQLFSLRLSGKQRIWGIRLGPIFKILWWDPEHEICKSNKKNT